MVNSNYLGCATKLAKEQLDFYTTNWVLEEKYDGWWCCLDIPKEGKITCTSRKNNLLEEATDYFNSCFALKPMEHLTIIGEWLPESGQLMAFDLLRIGNNNLKTSTQFERRNLLEKYMPRKNRITLVHQYHTNFKYIFDMITKRGGEGVVLKHLDSPYLSARKDKKSYLWIKCKPEYSNDKAA